MVGSDGGFRMYLLFISCSILVGCQNNKSMSIDEEFLDWSGRCLPGLYERAAELAGGDHLNCGYFSSFENNMSSKEFYMNLSNGLTCVDDAYKNRQPFVYGTFTIWIDTYLCEAFILNTSNELYRIFIDLDPSGGADRSGQRAWYIEEKCESLSISEKLRVPHYLNHVWADGCERLAAQ